MNFLKNLSLQNAVIVFFVVTLILILILSMIL